MNLDQLQKLPESDDLSIQVEHFKLGLISRATGNGYDDKEYRQLRKLILGIPGIEELIPRFIKVCRSVDEFWEWIKAEKSSYSERRILLTEYFNPIIEFLEYEESDGSFEFKKNYEEKGIIGKGGFGLVYRYEHRLLKLPFAVKVFAPAFYNGEEKELERFFQEARILFSLNHQSIIKVYDAGLIGKRPFIRMEFFDGKNLNEILTNFGRLAPHKALQLMENIVSGMEYAHEKIGVIHRDLKPSNIMAASPNQFRIVDFGLGIFIENELHSRFTKTNETTVGGYYTAPELISDSKLIDKRSDIYSLGAIWFTSITGQPPAGTSISESLDAIDGINKNYKNCIISCLSNLENRTPTCTELLSQIRKL